MPSPSEFDMVMDVIRAHVADAVASTGMGLKPFAQKNGMGETVVRDLVKAHNKDVQLGTLAKIAQGTGWSLVDLLRMPDDRPPLPTEADLEAALRDMLPGMPKGGPDKRARYLAEAVARALKLPPARQANAESSRPSREGGAPPPSATN